MGTVVSTSPQSISLPNSEKNGFSAIYRNLEMPDSLLSQYDPEVKTLYDNFRFGVNLVPKENCLGMRKFEAEGGTGEYYWQNYETIWKRIHKFGSGLIQIGCKQFEHIGIFSRNLSEWVISEQALYSQSMVVVSLYDTLGPDSVIFIINHASLSTVICTQDKIKKLIDIAEKCPNLKNLIQIEPEGNKDLIQQAEKKGLKIYSFAEIEDKGAFFSQEPVPPKPEDLATIMYTSGTTGVPKGVMLTHSNLIASVSSSRNCISLKSDDILISFLPMAHIFERIVQSVIFSVGASIGFFQGDVQKLFDDMAVLKPTLLPGVPRLFSRVFDKVFQAKDKKGGISKFLFDIGYSSRQSVLDRGQNSFSSLWNSMVFDRIKDRFGGKVRYIVTGAAPITKEVYRFLQICFSCPVMQGYGLTETSASCTLTKPFHIESGNAGAPQFCCEIRLADVPDMKYFSTDQPNPRGEICVRGPNVFKGYYQEPEQTKECFDEDGFFHTGDVGLINENGTLSIIDRKKNIFKLSQGEYVAAEYVEGVYQKNKFINQIFVYGDSSQSCLVAIVVPDAEILLPFAKEQNLPDDNIQELCNNAQIKETILTQMNVSAKEGKLLGFEVVKAIYLEHSPFSIENDLLTPTFKLKRPQLKQKYAEIIKGLYDSILQS
jgi:long-chain acyl-CoA synthetase